MPPKLTSTLLKRVQAMLSFVVYEIIHNKDGMSAGAQESTASELFHQKKNAKGEELVPVYEMFGTGEAPFDNPSIFASDESGKVLGSTPLTVTGLSEFTVADFMTGGNSTKKPPEVCNLRRASLSNATKVIAGATILNSARKSLQFNKKQLAYWNVRSRAPPDVHTHTHTLLTHSPLLFILPPPSSRPATIR